MVMVLLLGRAPAPRMRPVAQGVGDLADPGGGRGVEALRAVERERDGGLGDARFPRHVRGPGPPPAAARTGGAAEAVLGSPRLRGVAGRDGPRARRRRARRPGAASPGAAAPGAAAPGAASPGAWSPGASSREMAAAAPPSARARPSAGALPSPGSRPSAAPAVGVSPVLTTSPSSTVLGPGPTASCCDLLDVRTLSTRRIAVNVRRGRRAGRGRRGRGRPARGIRRSVVWAGGPRAGGPRAGGRRSGRGGLARVRPRRAKTGAWKPRQAGRDRGAGRAHPCGHATPRHTTPAILRHSRPADAIQTPARRRSSGSRSDGREARSPVLSGRSARFGIARSRFPGRLHPPRSRYEVCGSVRFPLAPA